jgi:hypothetical protein
MDVDPRVEDLTDDDADGENSSDEPLSGSSPSSSSGLSGLYDDGRQMFLSVPIIDVDGDPSENSAPLPVRGPSVAMLPGPSVLTSLVPIEERVDVLTDPRFVPPSLRGLSMEAGPDVEVKDELEESEGKVGGTPEYWVDGF